MKELMLDIAASIFIKPCTFDDLMERDFLKNKTEYGVGIILRVLEKDAIYYKGEKMYVYKKWAEKKIN